MKRLIPVVLALYAATTLAAETQTALAYPLFDAFYTCSEHFTGQFTSLGDALGTDCVVQKLREVNGRLWARAYENKGEMNQDWFGWNQDVLSPCDCVVSEIYTNPQENTPGVMGAGRASSITFRRADGVYFTIAHVRSMSVLDGERVKAGQAVAKVGNNGYSRNPHIHMGAWRAGTPLQIRFDQTKMKLPPEHRQQTQPALPAARP